MLQDKYTVEYGLYPEPKSVNYHRIYATSEVYINRDDMTLSIEDTVKFSINGMAFLMKSNPPLNVIPGDSIEFGVSFKIELCHQEEAVYDLSVYDELDLDDDDYEEE